MNKITNQVEKKKTEISITKICGITVVMIAQVNSSALAYEEREYDGEVYLMNLTCNNHLVDCVIFKLNGTTDLTRG